MAERIQLSRAKGWRMPENAVKVTRPGKWGNPFRVGGYFMVGDLDVRGVHPALRMSWCETTQPDDRFTLIADNATAVAFFRRLMASGWHKRSLIELRGKNLACWCKPNAECHADVLLELANAPLEVGAPTP